MTKQTEIESNTTPSIEVQVHDSLLKFENMNEVFFNSDGRESVSPLNKNYSSPVFCRSFCLPIKCAFYMWVGHGSK